MPAMLGGDGGGAPAQRAGAEAAGKRRKIARDRGRAGRQRCCPREPAPRSECSPSHSRRAARFPGQADAVTVRRTGSRRQALRGLRSSGVTRRPYLSLALRVRPWAAGRGAHRLSTRDANPSDSRGLIRLRQDLLRRGKHIFRKLVRIGSHLRAGLGQFSASARAKVAPGPFERPRQMRRCRGQAPCPSATLAVWPQHAKPLATSANEGLRVRYEFVK